MQTYCTFGGGGNHTQTHKECSLQFPNTVSELFPSSCSPLFLLKPHRAMLRPELRYRDGAFRNICSCCNSCFSETESMTGPKVAKPLKEGEKNTHFFLFKIIKIVEYTVH